ncbi:MAG: hypothetical protein PHI64_05950 [Zoogloea sp.]|uniref:PqqD family peptide modification chaperone n=1 Tax=Zoogloea sp. TaxID=49181 RepID=UPI00262F3F07|nr:PqqD family peptide modification chaperone [Zoogloea sp.]MDD2988490.1 hypothetical protein [Zoogloea sp.]
MPSAGIHYSACDALFDALPSILWKSVDEGWVRFDPHAGETLLLAPITRFILDQLSTPGQQLSEAALSQAVLQEEPDADPAECRAQVKIALEALLDARLIQATQH